MTYYRRGGISLYITRLVSALEALATPHRWTVFHSRKSRESLVEQFERSVLWTPAHHRIERYALSVELLRHRLDVLHSPDFIPPLRGGRFHVATVHDLTFLHYPQFLTQESQHYYNHQIAWAVAHADHILTISEASKRDIMSMLGVASEKITVHLPGVDDSFKPVDRETVARRLNALDLPTDYFLFVGTFEPRKNIIGLARAYRKLVDMHPGAPPLVLAGSPGWNFDDTRAAIDALSLPDHILWREAIPQDMLPALYSGALALIMPSFYEGFGLPPLEAMACGTLPIVSNRASLPEVVGPVGVQVDPRTRPASRKPCGVPGRIRSGAAPRRRRAGNGRRHSRGNALQKSLYPSINYSTESYPQCEP
ncbi:MAG: glycosyltransferase family 4 protein [Chloroflexi bacterium]|nr:glycosyltransferase family 4 protein [Chloroflexota bacterium]